MTKPVTLRVGERELQDALIEAAQWQGWFVMHTRPAFSRGKWSTPLQGDPGYPDLTMVHPQKGIIFAELKAEKEQLSKAQIEWMARIIAAGGHHYTWRPHDEDAALKVLADGPESRTPVNVGRRKGRLGDGNHDEG